MYACKTCATFRLKKVCPLDQPIEVGETASDSRKLSRGIK